MAYQRKTVTPPRLDAGWLRRRRAALLRSGIPPLLLEIARLRDAQGLTFAQVGAQKKFSPTYARLLYLRLQRLLKHPARKDLVPERIREQSAANLVTPHLRPRLKRSR